MKNWIRCISTSLFAGAACLALPWLVSAQNVGYSITPSYERIQWDDAFGLEDSRLYGVRAAFDFGPYFSLQPFYEWNNEVELRDGLVPPEDVEVADTYDVRLFGTEMQVNFGRGSIVPFVKGGGGVLRTDDEVEGRRDRIVLRAGGGVRFAFGERTGAELFAERLSTRLNEPFIPGAVDEDALGEDDIVNSMLYGAALRVGLGGGAPADGQAEGLLFGLFLQPYASRIDFDDEMNLPRQYTIGARGGVDFNRNVGLRAYWWRGVDDEFGEWMDIEGFGGEAQFALNTGPGISPFLVVGAGRITPFGDYVDEEGESRGQQDHVTLGAGLSWAIGERTNIELAARDLLMTVGQDVEDVTDPDDLVSNWQYSAGVSIAFGETPDREEGPTATDRAERDRLERELAELREENRRLREGEPQPRVEPGDTAEVRERISVPVPEVGEIILRYGEAYAPAERAPVPAATDSARAVIDSLQALTETLQADQARLAEAVREAVRAELDTLAALRGEPMQPTDPAQAQPMRPFYEDLALEALVPYTGFDIDSDGSDRLLVGLQADMGTFSESVPIRVIPDVVFGLGGGSPTLMVGVNGRFGWNIGTDYDIAPFVEAGLAVSDQRLLNANLGYGAEFDVGAGPDATRLFVEHRGVQAFDEHQILVGIRLPR